LSWSLTLPAEPPRNLEEAKKRLSEIQDATQAVIKILTAEQALRAQKVVREAGRKR
jgi:hypothetical protein